VAGEDWLDDGEGYFKAAIWTSANSGTSYTKTSLHPANGLASRARSVAVSGSTVYIAGFVFDNNEIPRATLWTNNIPGTLPVAAGYNSFATSVFVNGANVYVAGYISTNDGQYDYYCAVLWVNGVANYINGPFNPDIDSQAYGVHVANNIVFVSGYIADYNTGTWEMVVWELNGGKHVIAPPSEYPIQCVPYAVTANLRRAVPVTGVAITPPSATVLVNGTRQLTPVFTPANATNQGVTWTSSQPSIATVSETGLVTGVALGSATITARTLDGNFPAVCAITVAATLPDPDVYVAGRRAQTTNSNAARVAVYWKNGTRTDLFTTAMISDGVWGSGQSIFVDDNNDVYVAGYHDDTSNYNQLPSLWKNTAASRQDLAPWDAQHFQKWGESVFVSDGKVYVAGSEWATSNNQRVDLYAYLYTVTGGVVDTKVLAGNYRETFTEYAAALSVYVANDKTYVTGVYEDANNWYVPLWEGTARTTYQNNATGQAVFVSGANVYVGGTAFNGGVQMPTVWRNGVPTYYTIQYGASYGWVNAIYVVGTDVYATGYYGSDSAIQAVAWKNGEVIHTFGANNTTAYVLPTGISVCDGKVYVCGNERSGANWLPTYWTDGVATRLPVTIANSSVNNAYAIFVKQP